MRLPKSITANLCRSGFVGCCFIRQLTFILQFVCLHTTKVIQTIQGKRRKREENWRFNIISILCVPRTRLWRATFSIVEYPNLWFLHSAYFHISIPKPLCISNGKRALEFYQQIKNGKRMIPAYLDETQTFSAHPCMPVPDCYLYAVCFILKLLSWKELLMDSL